MRSKIYGISILLISLVLATCLSSSSSISNRNTISSIPDGSTADLNVVSAISELVSSGTSIRLAVVLRDKDIGAKPSNVEPAAVWKKSIDDRLTKRMADAFLAFHSPSYSMVDIQATKQLIELIDSETPGTSEDRLLDLLYVFSEADYAVVLNYSLDWQTSGSGMETIKAKFCDIRHHQAVASDVIIQKVQYDSASHAWTTLSFELNGQPFKLPTAR